MPPLPINQLVFKGTHNSYQCTGGTSPVMGHPPSVQIDDFGVWAVELDVGVSLGTGISTAVIGHDSPGDGVCSGLSARLIDCLATMRDTFALRYRPVFIYFDIKDRTSGQWADLDPDPCNDHTQKYALAIQAVEQVFPDLAGPC
jgi:hypothetical protein